MNTKTGPLTKGHNIRTHGNSNRLLEDLTTKSYIDTVLSLRIEEFQHLFNLNLEVLVRGSE
jgi:hypothetical protein